MQLIDRYILKLFLSYLAAGILVFVTLFLTVDVLSFASRNSDAGSTALAKYYAFHTPTIVYQLIPVACLMAVLFTLSQLNKTNELTALFSAGLSLRRIVSPVLIAVAVVSVLSFFLGDQVLPRLIQKRNYVEYVEIKKRPGLYSTVKTNKIWFRTENILFNIKTLSPETASAQGITLYYFDPNWDLTQLITSAKVDMKGNIWELKDGMVTLFATESSFPLTKSFKEKQITMNEDLRDLQATTNNSDQMSLQELNRFIERNKEAGLDTLRYEVDYHKKFGFAFAAFVMSLVGIPFSVGGTRQGGTFRNVGVCLLLAFLYWVAFSSSLTLGEHAVLPPIVAAWGPNVLVSMMAIFFMRRLKR